MKLERINENQIRCTLSHTDLADRELKISELAYGTEKAKALFQEMMSQASDELGFEANNIPLIIEAIPVSHESIMLIITKVEDPEELDTRFSRFSSLDDADDSDSDETECPYPDTEVIHDIFKRLSNDIIAKVAAKEGLIPNTDQVSPDQSDSEKIQETHTLFRIYEFSSLDQASEYATLLPNDFECISTLYKNPANHRYLLVLSNEEIDDAAFNHACCLASEFGTGIKASTNTLYYYDEHYETIIRSNAVGVLRNL